MSGKAVLTCRPNSHPFPERTLCLDQPVKIGRSVARARPASNNAIFDCKVLSRNHALIWYSNGKFYLQDTKSSNGTFVNNHRLSKSSEESLPREVCSGDIVQFGVDVLENTRKVTHGCIVANLKLYLPDGKEAKASLSTSVISSNNVPVENLYELYQYLQEAIQREQLLESKLTSLQEMLNTIREATDQGWKALIAEDRLLTRVDALESQLVIYSKNFGEDKVKEELKKLQEDKNVYQNTAKEFLKKILEEKLEAVQKYQDVKRSLLNLEAQYTSLNEELTLSKIHVQELAQKLSLQISRTDSAEVKLQEMEEEHRETIDRLHRRNQELEKVLEFHKEEDTTGLGDLNAPSSKVPFALRSSPSPVDKDIGMEDSLKAEAEDEDELMKKEAADLLTAQLDLLQYFGSSDKQLTIDQSHLNAQIRTSDLGKVSNGCEEPLEAKPKNQIFLEEEIKETKSEEDYKPVGDYSGINLAMRDEVKSSSEHLTKTSSLTLPNLEKTSQDLDGCHVIKEALGGDRKLCEEFVIDSVTQDDFENHLNRRNQNIEEKDTLRKQLIEAEQSAKQSRNEAAQLSDRLKVLTAELDSLKQKQQEQALDNKLRDELHKLTHDCFKSKGMISMLEAEVLSLKEELHNSQSENTRLSQELQQLEHLRTTVTKEGEGDQLQKVSLLEENLVLVSQRYMDCNEENTQLKRQLHDLQLDYQAISHQPYFNLFFALPCIMLILAITIAFYPTLSSLMGTADKP
ncbi:sarcolemma associated protein isoform X1 [Rhodnius prolixus]|uniref:sarcolemma associated protein isoform X1 n=1 Tax=Rhodnius prolixus TaxID=13249 RepID=UPI003D18FC1B